MSLSCHCQSCILAYSGGQRYVIQLGCESVGVPPGHPEKPTITFTPSFSASRTVLLKVAISRSAIDLSGCIGLPWQLRVAILMFLSSNFLRQALSFASSANNSGIGQCLLLG